MNIVILTPVRLFGQGLLACLEGHEGVHVEGLAHNFQALRAAVRETTELALIDVSQGYAADEVRTFAAACPRLKLVALGLRE